MSQHIEQKWLNNGHIYVYENQSVISGGTKHVKLQWFCWRNVYSVSKCICSEFK